MFSFALGVSNSLIYKVRGPEPVHRARGDKSSAKAERVLSFLDGLAKYGEQQPDSHEVHLSQPSKRMVYNMFKVVESTVSVSYVWFLRTWTEYRSHIKIREIQRQVTHVLFYSMPFFRFLLVYSIIP
jgi:hypothetical protein